MLHAVLLKLLRVQIYAYWLGMLDNWKPQMLLRQTSNGWSIHILPSVISTVRPLRCISRSTVSSFCLSSKSLYPLPVVDNKINRQYTTAFHQIVTSCALSLYKTLFFVNDRFIRTPSTLIEEAEKFIYIKKNRRALSKAGKSGLNLQQNGTQTEACRENWSLLLRAKSARAACYTCYYYGLACCIGSTSILQFYSSHSIQLLPIATR